MLTSIHPLGERARGQRWVITVASFIVGSIAGGGLLGWWMGLLGSLVIPAGSQTARALAVGVLAVVAAAEFAGWKPHSFRRQVNEDWLGSFRGWVYGAGFGLQLGFGIATIVTSVATYAVVILAGLTGSALAGATVGAAFGLARALPVVTTRRIESAQQLARLHRRLVENSTAAARAVSVGSVALMAALVLGGTA